MLGLLLSPNVVYGMLENIYQSIAVQKGRLQQAVEQQLQSPSSYNANAMQSLRLTLAEVLACPPCRQTAFIIEYITDLICERCFLHGVRVEFQMHTVQAVLSAMTVFVSCFQLFIRYYFRAPVVLSVLIFQYL